jgi:ketosteroid isomerase-like protein
MTETIEQQILSHEDQLIHAKRTLDTDSLDRIYADDVMMTGVLGEPTCSKAAIIDEAKRGIAQRDSAIATGKSIQTSGRNEDMKIIAYADAAIASYRFVVQFKGENLDIDRRYRTTNVWVKRQGRWQIVAAHTSLVLDSKQVATLGS